MDRFQKHILIIKSKLSTYYVLGIILSALHVLFYLILTILQIGTVSSTHHTNEETDS